MLWTHWTTTTYSETSVFGLWIVALSRRLQMCVLSCCFVIRNFSLRGHQAWELYLLFIVELKTCKKECFVLDLVWILVVGRCIKRSHVQLVIKIQNEFIRTFHVTWSNWGKWSRRGTCWPNVWLQIMLMTLCAWALMLVSRATSGTILNCIGQIRR